MVATRREREVFDLMPDGYLNQPNSMSPKKIKILVVEDDTQLLRLERFILEEAGYEVSSASNGEQAVDSLLEASPSLVLLDIGLPGMDGFTTCQRIREFSEVPIIIVTVDDRDEDKVRALEMGADDYVTKPFSVNELVARVKAALRRPSIGHVTPRPAPPARQAARPPEPAPDNSNSNSAAAPDVVKEEARPPKRSPPAKQRSSNSRRTTQITYTEAPDDAVYEGTVRLIVETAGSFRGMVNFVDELRQNPQFRLLRLVANQNKEGMDIWLGLREPLLLKAALLQMGGVAKVNTPVGYSLKADEHLLHVCLGE